MEERPQDLQALLRGWDLSRRQVQPRNTCKQKSGIGKDRAADGAESGFNKWER